MTSDRYPIWLQAGLGVIAGLCLISGVAWYRDADAFARANPDPYLINAQPERLREASRLLPDKAVIGYLSDLSFDDAAGSAAYFGVANALAPRLVVRSADDPPWVIGNFSRPQDFVAAGAAHRLDLVRDLGNGVLLFRRRGDSRPAGSAASTPPVALPGADPMALLPLAIAILLGYFGVALWVPDAGGRSRWAPLLRAGLGTALGLGVTACLYLAIVIAGVPSLPLVLGFEGVALLALAAIYLLRRSAQPPAGDPLPSFSWSWALAGAAAVLLGLFVSAFLTASESNPQGGWDAFAIWNLRAHYLVQAGTWRYAVTAQPTGTHMEYPLLLSSFVARGWLYAGAPMQAVPIAIALLVSLALAALLASTLSVLRSTAVGLLAVLLLLANQVLWNAAPEQYADLPLALFGLAAAALLALDPRAEGSPRYLTLAGLLASFAAATKNEGTLLLAAVTAALLVTGWRSNGTAGALRRVGFLLLGALPVLAVVLWFKISAAPPDPLVSGMGKALLHKTGDASRWLRIAGGFLQGLPGVALALLALAAALLRPRPAAERIPPAFLPLVAFAIVLAGDFAVFLLTPDETGWLLSTALDRLYLQLWPLLLLSVFLLLRRPEDFALPTAAASPLSRTKKARR